MERIRLTRFFERTSKTGQVYLSRNLGYHGEAGRRLPCQHDSQDRRQRSAPRRPLSFIVLRWAQSWGFVGSPHWLVNSPTDPGRVMSGSISSASTLPCDTPAHLAWSAGLPLKQTEAPIACARVTVPKTAPAAAIPVKYRRLANRFFSASTPP